MLKSECKFFEMNDRLASNPILPGCRPEQFKSETVEEATTEIKPYIAHTETVSSKSENENNLSSSYEVVRPDYSSECEKMDEKLKCFDHFEFGYSDSLCTRDNCDNILKTYRCNCHQIHTQFATSKYP